MRLSGRTLPLALLAGLTLGAGCGYRLARREPPPIDAFGAPPTGQAQVCVLRPRLAPSSLMFLVHDNGRLVGATRGSSYFCYYAEPGPHRVTSRRAGIVEDATMQLEGGTRYYLYQNVDPYPDATRSWLSWTSETDARSMVGECAYRVLSSAGSEERPGDRPTAKADPGLAVAASKGTDSGAAAREEKKEPEPPQVAPAPTSDASQSQITDAKTAPEPVVPKRKRRRSAPSGPREMQ
jgi:hypothetical protein